MIIQALYGYYNQLILDPDSSISPPGYSVAKVSFALNISASGELLDLIDLRQEIGKKLISRALRVPEQVKRTSGVSPNFLCDNVMYVFGFGISKDKEAAKTKEIVITEDKFEAFRQHNNEILKEVDDPGAKAVLNFLENWDPNKSAVNKKITEYMDDLLNGSNLVFKLDGELGYIHERPEVKKAWERITSEKDSEYKAQCLVTGKKAAISRIHQNIKGVSGAQSSGASLVSFNIDSFESFGKKQSFNAPVSNEATFGYTTALNYLLSDERHRIRVGDTTTVFWAEKPSYKEEDLMVELLDPHFYDEANGNTSEESVKHQRDPQTLRLLSDILRNVQEGRPVTEKMLDIDPDITFYILGLAPNNSRLSIRYWYVDSFVSLAGKIAQHYSDLSIEGLSAKCIPVWMILKEIAVQRDSKNIPPLLGGTLMRSVLTGVAYPESLYTAILSRIRADSIINPVRASIIKACLLRKIRIYNPKYKEEVLTMGLNENSDNTAYRLGRLFALLEKAQQDAIPGLNATIKDRFFGAASATPAIVFPQLLRLAQHHITKAEYGGLIDKKIEEVFSGIEKFPAHLNLEEQGIFVLGYYHQRQAIYKKNEKKEG